MPELSYEDILEEYLERVGKNLVGAILINYKNQVIALKLRNKKIKNDTLEFILKKVSPYVKQLIKNKIFLNMETRTIETDEYFILLTVISEKVLLVSIFALNAMIESFISFTKTASVKLKQMIDNYKIDSTDSKKSIRKSISDTQREKNYTKERMMIKLVNLTKKSEEKKYVAISDNIKLINLKKIAGKTFNLNIRKFYLTYGGIIMDESRKTSDYNIKEGEHIVLIPAKYKVRKH